MGRIMVFAAVLTVIATLLLAVVVAVIAIGVRP